jgi:hypothetical protein
MYEDRRIVITKNPAQLRQLADAMERRYSKLALGDSTFVDFLGYSDTLQVCLHLDQQWFEDKKHE